jgi:hypothetical protein
MQETEQATVAQEIETEKFEFEMVDLGPSYDAAGVTEVGVCVCMCGRCFCSCVSPTNS